MSITVFLAEDHRIVREGFKLLLETHPDIKVIGEAGDGREAVRQVLKLNPDIVIMDIAMPEMNGIEATREISESLSTCKVVILSMYSTPQHVFRALNAGAKGYILKGSAGEDVVKAVRMVHSGRTYVCSEISEVVINDYLQKREMRVDDDPISRLSQREREIVQLLVEGKSNAKIAELLCLSQKTVETYRSHIMQKLGIPDLPSLVKFAIQQGITSVD
jgi:DNA-binding NarL/FixJ family response regulator